MNTFEYLEQFSIEDHVLLSYSVNAFKYVKHK